MHCTLLLPHNPRFNDNGRQSINDSVICFACSTFCFSFPITRSYTIINSRAFNSAKPIHSFTFSLPGPLLILFLNLVQLLWTFFSLASPLFRFINKISTLLSAHAKVTFSLSPPQHDDHEEEQPATATAQHHDIHSAPFFAYDVL